MKKLDLRVIIALAAATTGPSLAQVRDDNPRHASGAIIKAVADLTSTACYGIQSGTINFSNGDGPNDLDKDIHTIEQMGLKFGISQPMMDQLGPAGTTLISRATMGSKTVDGASLILAAGGQQPGCRVILLADPSTDITNAVASALIGQNGWKAVPEMTANRGAVTRRAFLRRDKQGNPYLLNLMTAANPTSSHVRLITTVVRIPPRVAIPAGY